VRSKLFGDPQLTGGGSIAVIVEGARVRLEGWVDSVNERTLAEVDAATVAGVVSVDNLLLVRGAGAGRLTR
jgi:osmotically-inducible protein OsmY